MIQTIEGRFVADGSYRGLLTEDGRRTLTSAVDALFDKGTIVQVKLQVEYLGKRPLCQERNKYSQCNEVLNADGSCPDEATHVVPEPEPEYDTVSNAAGSNVPFAAN